MTRLMTTIQAARIFNISHRRMRELCRIGMILGATKHGRDWLIQPNARGEIVRLGSGRGGRPSVEKGAKHGM